MGLAPLEAVLDVLTGPSVAEILELTLEEEAVEAEVMVEEVVMGLTCSRPKESMGLISPNVDKEDSE